MLRGLAAYTIFCDMDGVIADFDKKFTEHTKRTFANVPEHEAWDLLKGIPNFWLSLELMPDGEQLWQFLQQLNPIFLTAPSTHDELRARYEKRLWVNAKFGESQPIVYRRRRYKQNLAAYDSILIDDMLISIEEWRKRGGIGIHHTSAESTIAQLKKLDLQAQEGIHYDVR